MRIPAWVAWVAILVLAGIPAIWIFNAPGLGMLGLLVVFLGPGVFIGGMGGDLFLGILPGAALVAILFSGIGAAVVGGAIVYPILGQEGALVAGFSAAITMWYFAGLLVTGRLEPRGG